MFKNVLFKQIMWFTDMYYNFKNHCQQKEVTVK